ncbi:uncharacterized protein [Macrobrachium rosenbergii]|uniref:uncharacterized protein isoform X2 n=1 Tax=Macrobrachium rosenbergii TaxID=79674 RepID=UPI0034D5A06D
MATAVKIEKEASLKTEDPAETSSCKLQEYYCSPNGYCSLPSYCLQYGGIYSNVSYIGMIPCHQTYLNSSAWPNTSVCSNSQMGFENDSLYYIGDGYYPTDNLPCVCYNYIPDHNGIQTHPEVSQGQQVAFQSAGEYEASETVKDLKIASDLPPALQNKSFFSSDKNSNLYTPGAMLGRPILMPSVPSKGRRGVEELFQQYMQLFFRNLPDVWCLFSIESHDTMVENSFFLKDSCKVRFFCQVCGDGWTSMNGLIAFYYQFSDIEHCGRIGYTIYGQMCYKCNDNEFKDPLWYPEEAHKVIANLYYEIASRYYNFVTPRRIRTRRLGAPRTRHSSDLCQGCNLGLYP